MIHSDSPGKSRSSLSTGQLLGQVLPLILQYRTRVVVAALSLLLATAATLTLPIAFRLLIDNGFSVSSNEARIADFNAEGLFVMLFGLALVLAMTTAVRFYCVAWLGDRVTADLRADIYARVLRQDPVFFESLKTGEVLSRLSADTTLVQTLVGSSISFGLRSLLLFTGSLLMMFVTNAALASIIVVLLLFTVVPIMLVAKRVRKLSRDSQDRLADTGALAGEALGGMQIVQAYVREQLEAGRYKEATEAAFISAVRRNLTRSILTMMVITLFFGVIVFVLWMGANAVAQGSLSAGTLTQFMLYAALVGGSTSAIAEVLGDVQRAAGAMERLIELRQQAPRIVSGPIDAFDETAEHDSRFGASCQFSDVTFSYPSRPDEQALHGLSFKVSPGSTVALVGPSGAGKSTVLQLLLRFYDPQSGKVLVNGIDTSTLSLPLLRSSIGLVSQESVVFSSTVRENIRYGRLDASDAQIQQAAIASEAHDFIERLPEGYDTSVGERGVRLSGGQRQRLAIARALVKNPPLLLLDEATSALDTISEQKVQRALNQAMQGRTTLVIAHRLATVMSADHILVLDEGRFVESGTHAELMAAKGVYARLAAMQFT